MYKFNFKDFMQQNDLENMQIPIGQLASLLNISQRTLRIYEQERILIPQRSIGNRRLYCLKDIEKAKMILFLTRNLAVNLSGVKIIFEIFKRFEIKPQNYFDLINEIAKTVDIRQNENIIKASKKGRKQKSSIS